MKFEFNHSWAFFVGAELCGKTYQTKRIIDAVLRSKKATQEQIVILDPNNKFEAYKKAERIVPYITQLNVEVLDITLRNMRGLRDILFVGDDIDVFLRSGYESIELDRLGKTIKQQSIGGILHTHRPNFFNSRIYQIMDFIFVGWGLAQGDQKYLMQKCNLDVALYAKIRKYQFVLIDRNANTQKIIDTVV